MDKKKCFIISIFLFVLLFITGCNSEKIRVSAAVKGAEGTLDGTIYYTPGEKIYFSMRNNTDRDLSYSMEGTWEKFEDNEWQEVFVYTGIVFPTSLLLGPGEETEAYGKKIPIGYRTLEKDEKLSTGKYRFRLNVTRAKTEKWDNSSIKERTENISFEFEVK